MKVIAKKTVLSRKEVLEKAKKFFEGRFGLHSTEEQTDCCITFSNNLGFVTVEVSDMDAVREVTVRTREWENPSWEFLHKL